MEARTQGIIVVAALLGGLSLAGPAAAKCAYQNAPVAAVVAKKVGVFSAAGKFLKDVEASAIVAGTTVLDCNEELGIVKLRVEGIEQWVDRLALDIRTGRKPACIARAASRESDVTAPVSSGVGESCQSGGK